MEKKKRIAWNNGLKTGLVPKSAFKKGHISWSKLNKGKYTTSKKGKKLTYTIWNKGKNGLQVGWCKGTKGIMKSNKQSFKKGHIPSNKGKKRPEITGDKNPSWKGGITPENHKIRNSIEYGLWRNSVFARDNWTCQKCKEKGKFLHPHHILNFSSFKELRFAIDNGITLCKKCHMKFHNIYKRKNNSREQLQEFLNNK